MRSAFVGISLSVKGEIERIRKSFGHVQASHAFVGLFLWRDSMRLSVSFGDDAFLVACGGDFFFPCGSERGKRLFISEILASYDPGEDFPELLYASADDVEFCRRFFPGEFCEFADENSREYIYDRAEQIQMSGKKFAYQRAKVNRARRAGQCVSLSLCEKTLPVARDIALEWAERRGDDSGDLEQTLEALENFEALCLYGNILVQNSVPVGFNMGSFIAEDTFDIHISKTLADDVDALMKLELYKSLPDRVKYINREEDLGITGLRVHKQDAQPCAFNEIYRICRH